MEITTKGKPETPVRRVKRMEALQEAAKPLIEFMNTWCNPHHVVIIEQGHVALYSGECGFPTEVPD